MEDPTKIDISGSGRSSGDENKTAIKADTTGGSPSGDFVAGTILASRYRIIGLVGKGGMGEVYKAEDIKLSQMVALKFLPDSYQNDSSALERFHSEVRNARQVSHVNVCRVFDIGEIDGRHFLSMEFVDGDDLSDLLTRVGRFTHERAVEVSRQLCVGMEAIHKAGILHRDFKPANIIIDKKGIARITDFGIAGIEAEISKDGIRAGTPAYMAPEQITGKEVSPRSDIYALGLVIYEIFTGKQAFVADNVIELIKKHQTETPTNPSEIVKGIDPLVESTIAQCLEKDPKNRPQSALHVAMALPGGNPMQMALDAGQTPSPEMVAAAPTVGALRPAVAFSLLAIVLFSLGLLTLTSKNYYLHRMVPLDKPPDVLRERGRELMAKFGYQGSDSYSGFDTPWIAERTYFEVLKESDHSPDVWQKLRAGQPALIQFWYRTSPLALERESAEWLVHDGSQNAVPGAARLRLDTKGRLLRFEGNPPRIDEPSSEGTKDLDWADVLKEAGFNLSTFKPTEPQLAPPQAFDDRRAFSGVYPEAPDIPIRIEAAAYRGRLVNFNIIEPWTGFGLGWPVPLFLSLGTTIYFGVLILSVFLAVPHLRAGKSDLKGTVRVAVFVFIARMVMWLFSSHQVISLLPEIHAFWGEVGLILAGLEASLFWAATAASMYLAFEPYLRRSAPERIISWNRLLAGNWRDPLVGRDILIGLAAGGVIIAVVYYLVGYLLIVMQGSAGPLKILDRDKHAIFGGVSGFFARFADALTHNLIQVFLVSLVIVFMGMLVRSKRLGVAIICLILVVLQVSQSLAQTQTPYEFASNLLTQILFILVAARFGVLAMISMAMFIEIFETPVTTELGAWYAVEFVLYAAVLIALAVFGFYTSTAGQKLWQGKLLGDGD